VVKKVRESFSDENATGQCIKWLKSHKKTKTRVKNCRLVLAWHAGDDIIFSDEELFLLQETHHQQNDQNYCIISKKCNLLLLFIEAGVNIEHVLEIHVFDHARNLHREDYFCCQQDSAPSHKVKRTRSG
jgi:hypothetical protein